MDLAQLRFEYSQAVLDETSAKACPFEQFAGWMEDALRSGLLEPTAMSLATVDRSGSPNCRMVLLKAFDAKGFVFYTNYTSRKGEEIASTPRAALVLYWAELERQVRIRGGVERVASDESDEYFAGRPLPSQLGAAVSPQSKMIPGRGWLELQMSEIKKRYPSGEIPRPPHWGGFRVKPVEIEFWQGRRSRLHDRLLYTRDGGGGWTITRLAP